MKHKIKRVTIEISTLCNSKCITCPQSKINRDKRIDIEIAKRIIEKDCLVYKDSIEFFEFHNYNEPLLTFDIFHELTLLVNSTYGDYKVGLVSNASKLTEQIADTLIELKLKHIYFSVDGFSKEVFEAHRIGLNRHLVYKNIEMFIKKCKKKASAIYPNIIYVVTKKNKHEIEKFQKYFADKHCSTPLQDCDGRGGESKESHINDEFIDTIPCSHALETVYILSNLDVVPCCMDWNGIEVMGNLRNNTLQEIVDGNKYQDFRNKHNTGSKRKITLCSSCKTNLTYNYPRHIERD